MAHSLKCKDYLQLLPGEITVENNEVSSLLAKRLDYKVLAKALSLQTRTIENYFNRNRIPIFLLKHLLLTENRNFFRLYEKERTVAFSKWKKVTLPNKLTPNLAYFIGYLQGDGSVESNGKRIQFTDEYESQIDNINEICQSIFSIRGLKYTYTSPLAKKPVYVLAVGSKVLNCYIHTYFEINRGVKKDLKIPEQFKSHPYLIKRYLTGLYDADGTLPKDAYKCKQQFIDITLKDKSLILAIKEELNKLGVKTLKPYCRVAKSPNSDFISRTWELRIRRRADIIMFLKEVGFSHPEKSRRSKKLLNFLGQ